MGHRQRAQEVRIPSDRFPTSLHLVDDQASEGGHGDLSLQPTSATRVMCEVLAELYDLHWLSATRLTDGGACLRIFTPFHFNAGRHRYTHPTCSSIDLDTLQEIGVHLVCCKCLSNPNRALRYLTLRHNEPKKECEEATAAHSGMVLNVSVCGSVDGEFKNFAGGTKRNIEVAKKRVW